MITNTAMLAQSSVTLFEHISLVFRRQILCGAKLNLGWKNFDQNIVVWAGGVNLKKNRCFYIRNKIHPKKIVVWEGG